MTERLYYHDAHLLTFEAHVIAHDGDACRVVLDRTAFYPTSGGQPHDTGQLGNARYKPTEPAPGRYVKAKA